MNNPHRSRTMRLLRRHVLRSGLSLQRPGDFVIVLQPVGESRRRVFRDFPAGRLQPVLKLDVKMVNVVAEKRLFKLLAFAGIQFA